MNPMLPADSIDRLLRLLIECTVRISVPNGVGTGFFVAPGWIVTCRHVVARGPRELAGVWFRHGTTADEPEAFNARIETVITEPGPDLALLRVLGEVPPHPCV